MKLIILILVMIIFISGCVSQSPEEYNESEVNDITEETENNTNVLITADENAVSLCESICQEFLNEGVDLSMGPCLSDNNPDWDVTDWACDVAHIPRQGIDSLNANQCLAFRVGEVHHFVEVDENCDLIRAY